MKLILRENITSAGILKREEMYKFQRLSAQIEKRKWYICKTDKDAFTLLTVIDAHERLVKENKEKKFKFFEEGEEHTLKSLEEMMQALLLGDDKYFDLMHAYDKELEQTAPIMIPVMYKTDAKPGEIALWSKEDKQQLMFRALKQLGGN